MRVSVNVMEILKITHPPLLDKLIKQQTHDNQSKSVKINSHC